MIVEFDKSFEKSLDKIRNKLLFQKIKKVIIQSEKAGSISELSNIKKLTGYKTYYRIRIGEYRIGIDKISDNTVRFIIVAHRKDIYNLFP
jgi:mRNA interferase RelE/StbE